MLLKKRLIVVLVAFTFGIFLTPDAKSSNVNQDLAGLNAMNIANQYGTGDIADCESGVPDLSCPIWVVNVVIGWPSNQLECTTGGEYKCEFKF